MDVQLKELIDKIKNDGVKNAEENAARIIADAEVQAAAVLKTAQANADKLRETAIADADKTERSGREALRQAGRDLILTVKGEIETLFSKVLEHETAGVLDGELFSELVSSAVASLSGDKLVEIDILVPEKNFSEVENGLLSKLGKDMSSGMEIKPFKGLKAGFRISMKDGSAFYDFSDSEIAAMLSRSLNPRLASLLSE
ncbi:MAG: V-type ATP synthase subunit E [Spirochaetaceae bacterium]|nr:V-type ATP synthase subunit E [Spirochaetaceae bacterium]